MVENMSTKKLMAIIIVWSICLITASIYPIFVVRESKPPNVALSRELELYLSFQFPHARIMLVDGEYTLVDKPLIESFLRYDKTNLRPYINETFDCDDFAFTLWRNIRESQGNIAFGVISLNLDGTTSHAMNFFVDTNWHIYFVEPQNDEIKKRHNVKYMRASWIIM